MVENTVNEIRTMVIVASCIAAGGIDGGHGHDGGNRAGIICIDRALWIVHW